MLSDLQPFAISLIIGLVIGIQRERSLTQYSHTMGVRSFVFIALIGTLSAWLNEMLFTVILSSFVFIMIIINYLQVSHHNHSYFSIITELAAGIVYCLGYMTMKTPLLASIIGTVVLLVLLGTQQLHKFSRKRLSEKEIQAAATIAVLAFIILPFLPNHPIDPWQLFNPQRFGIIVLVIAGLQFSGYVALRVFGSRLGLLLIGFFGGFVSSTAVFVTLPKIYKHQPQLLKTIVSAAIFSTLSMLIEVIIIISIISPTLLISVIWPLIAMLVVGLVFALLMSHSHTRYIPPTLINPVDLKSALKLAVLIFSMLVLIAIATKYLGVEGGWLAAFFGGLFELHSVTLATATIYTANKIALFPAQMMLALAVLASFISKFLLLLLISRNQFAALTALGLALILITGATTYWFISLGSL